MLTISIFYSNSNSEILLSVLKFQLLLLKHLICTIFTLNIHLTNLIDLIFFCLIMKETRYKNPINRIHIFKHFRFLLLAVLTPKKIKTENTDQQNLSIEIKMFAL